MHALLLLLSIRSLLPILDNLLDRRPVYHLLVPRAETRVLLGQIRRLPLSQQQVHVQMPRHKRQVRKGNLVPHQVLSPLLLQVPVNDAEDALDFIGVAVDGGLNALFRMVVGEPDFLAKIGALARGLEVQPAEGGVLFFGGGVGEVV